MTDNNQMIHFLVALCAGLLTGFSGLCLAYILEHAYGVPVPRESPIMMTVAVVTIAVSLAILNWREDFYKLLEGERPMLSHPTYRVWLATFGLWFVVVVLGSVHVQQIQGAHWYQQMPGALIYYIVPTYIWLHLTRLVVKARYLNQNKESHVRAS